MDKPHHNNKPIRWYKAKNKKNPMGNEEVRYFTRILKDNFEILDQLGMSGKEASAYLLKNKDGKKFVLKIPNDSENLSWIDIRKEEINKSDLYMLNYSRWH